MATLLVNTLALVLVLATLVLIGLAPIYAARHREDRPQADCEREP